MGKFMQAVDAPKKKDEKEKRPKPPTVCHDCGWNFIRDNEAMRGYDKHDETRMRKEPRTAITVGYENGEAIAQCTPCYESALWRKGKHTKQGHEGGQLYRTGLLDQIESIARRKNTRPTP